MTVRKEMIPVPKRRPHHSIGLCNPEWQLLCWVHRELGLIKLKTPKVKILSDVALILTTMNDTFNDWPEDSK